MFSTFLLLPHSRALPTSCRWQPLAALLAVLAGIMLSLSPLINSVVEGDTPIFSDNGGIITLRSYYLFECLSKLRKTGIVWSFIFMLSVAPGIPISLVCYVLIFLLWYDTSSGAIYNVCQEKFLVHH